MPPIAAPLPAPFPPPATAPPAAPTAAPTTAPIAASFTTSCVLFCSPTCDAAYRLQASTASCVGTAGTGGLAVLADHLAETFLPHEPLRLHVPEDLPPTLTGLPSRCDLVQREGPGGRRRPGSARRERCSILGLVQRGGDRLVPNRQLVERTRGRAERLRVRLGQRSQSDCQARCDGPDRERDEPRTYQVFPFVGLPWPASAAAVPEPSGSKLREFMGAGWRWRRRVGTSVSAA